MIFRPNLVNKNFTKTICVCDSSRIESGLKGVFFLQDEFIRLDIFLVKLKNKYRREGWNGASESFFY
jgi:hypothetical protein